VLPYSTRQLKLAKPRKKKKKLKSILNKTGNANIKGNYMVTSDEKKAA